MTKRSRPAVVNEHLDVETEDQEEPSTVEPSEEVIIQFCNTLYIIRQKTQLKFSGLIFAKFWEILQKSSSN